MRKFILLFVIFSSFIGSGQVELKPGIKAGLNLANFTHTNYDAKTDFYAGIKLGVKFTERYTLQPEIVYSRQGARPQFDAGTNSDIQIDYLSIGITNKFLLFEEVNLHLVIGPFFDFKINDNIDDYSSLFEFLDYFDIGFFTGVDYEFSSGFGLEIRYKLGFNEISGVDINSNNTHYNKVFQLGLSYNFNF